MNYIVVIIGIILVVVGIVTIVKGKQYISQTVEQIEIAHKREIQESYAQEREELKQFQHNKELLIADLARDHEAWKIRAREARESTEQLIQSEQRRLDTEIEKKKELEEVRWKNYQEQKEGQLDIYFQRLTQKYHEEYDREKEKLNTEILFLKSQLDDFRARQESVNEAILREKELKEQEDFYSVQLSDNDKEDIAYLQSMDLKLHNRDVIPKLIWDLYMRRPAQEMIKRVTGSRDVCGIYKITNKKTGEAYIGKTVSISTRWQNHLKTAVGLDAAARSTLHTRLAADGVWNYTFEILEEVSKENLSEREAFYIDLYGTKKQLNMKSGDKNGTQ